MDFWEEWQIRCQVLNESLRILADGEERSGRQIAQELNGRGIKTDKSLVNSVLFSEGRRYVRYDRKKYSYRIKGEPFAISDLLPVQHNARGEAMLSATTVEHMQHYSFHSEYLDSQAFFGTDARGGRTAIVLNLEHPYFRKLAALNASPESDCTTLYAKLREAQDCIRVLLQAWSDFENEQPIGAREEAVQDARIDWGRKLRDLLIE